MKIKLLLLIAVLFSCTTALHAQDTTSRPQADTLYPTFKGGQEAWGQYLVRNLRTNVPIRNGAKAGIYIINVRFQVETDGSITNVAAENDRGFGTAEEAVRVIKKSPRWNPATINGKPILAIQRQPVVFQLVNQVD